MEILKFSYLAIQSKAGFEVESSCFLREVADPHHLINVRVPKNGGPVSVGQFWVMYTQTKQNRSRWSVKSGICDREKRQRIGYREMSVSEMDLSANRFQVLLLDYLL